MPTERRLSPAFRIYELRGARVWTARKTHWCVWCKQEGKPWIGMYSIQPGDTYVRISETRLPVCQRCAGFTDADIVTITREGK